MCARRIAPSIESTVAQRRLFRLVHAKFKSVRGEAAERDTPRFLSSISREALHGISFVREVSRDTRGGEYSAVVSLVVESNALSRMAG